MIYLIFSTHKFRLAYNAVVDYEYYKIKKWFIDENIFKITIRSQFLKVKNEKRK